MKTLAGVSKHWNKNIFQLLARDKVQENIDRNGTIEMYTILK